MVFNAETVSAFFYLITAQVLFFQVLEFLPIDRRKLFPLVLCDRNRTCLQYHTSPPGEKEKDHIMSAGNFA